jgi:hypothetical protein
MKPLLSRIDWFAQAAMLGPLFIYLLTLAPSVTFFDSGEFITAISCLGSSHSPGYPFFVNFGKPFTWIPFGSIAFRVNFATAVSGALASFGVYFLTVYLLRNEQAADDGGVNDFLRKGVALAAAFTFCCTPRLWLQSNHDKPYPLVAFIVAVILFLVFRWRESYVSGEERPGLIYMGAFLCGLATGAHHTIVLMIPAFAFLILVTDWRIVFRVRDFLVALIFGLLGFAINLHLPIRATRNPLLNWGDPQTKEQFLWHFLRKGYPSEKVDRDWSLLWAQMNAFNIPFEFTVVGLVIMSLGMACFLKKYRAEVGAYFIALTSFLLVIVGYFNTPAETIFLTEEFFTPLYLYSAVFIGLGLFSLLSRLQAIVPRTLFPTVPLKVLLGLLLLVLPGTVCALNYVKNDQHLNYVAYDYASNVLRSAPQGGIIYTWGDSGAFPIWYIQGVERMREDLDVLHTPHLVFDWYLNGFPHVFTRYSILRRIPLDSLTPENCLLLAMGEQYPSRPVLIDYSTRYSVPFSGYRMRQRGIVYQMLTESSPVSGVPDLNVWNLYATRGFIGNQMFFRDLDTGKAILIYGNSRLETGESLIREGQLGPGLESLRAAAVISPELGPEVNTMLTRFGAR